MNNKHKPGDMIVLLRMDGDLHGFGYITKELIYSKDYTAYIIHWHNTKGQEWKDEHGSMFVDECKRRLQTYMSKAA